MFIEVKLKVHGINAWRIFEMVFNSSHLIHLSIKPDCLLCFNLNGDMTTLQFDSIWDAEKVYKAFKHALTGLPNVELPNELGYVRPIQRPFMDETTLIPSAYEGDELQ